MLPERITSSPPSPTLREAAEVCRLHHTTLRRAIRDGRLRASRPTGREIRIAASAFEQRFATTSAELQAEKIPGNADARTSHVGAALSGTKEHQMPPKVSKRVQEAPRDPPLTTATAPPGVGCGNADVPSSTEGLVSNPAAPSFHGREPDLSQDPLEGPRGYPRLPVDGDLCIGHGEFWEVLAGQFC